MRLRKLVTDDCIYVFAGLLFRLQEADGGGPLVGGGGLSMGEDETISKKGIFFFETEKNSIQGGFSESMEIFFIFWRAFGEFKLKNGEPTERRGSIVKSGEMLYERDL